MKIKIKDNKNHSVFFFKKKKKNLYFNFLYLLALIASG